MSIKSFREYIKEVRIIGRGIPKEPLQDDETIRVYHGAYEVSTVVQALKYGLSGDRRADRRYSYERDNNPRGLFVTPDLDVAKEFGDYVLEFHARVGDLEAPVWPGGSFTKPGEMTQMFGDEETREVERVAQRERISKDAAEYVLKSDSPDVAFWLMDVGETQALFRGDLDRNSVRAVWVSSNPERVKSPYDRMKPSQFLKQHEREGIPNRFGSRTTPDDIKDELRDAKKRVFKPREDATVEKFIDRIIELRPSIKRDSLLNILRNNPDMIEDYVWSRRQLNQMKRDMERNL